MNENQNITKIYSKLSTESNSVASRLDLYMHKQPKSFNNKYLGVDFGSMNFRIAYINDTGNPVIIDNSENENHTPSAIYFNDIKNFLVGKPAKESMLQRPDRVVDKIKQYINKPDYLFQFEDLFFNTQELCSYLLKKLKMDAEINLGMNLRNILIPVPAHFGPNERKTLTNAAKIAGMKARTIIEPLAAAYSLGRDVIDDDQIILIYDLGGCSFDVSIVEIKEKEAKMIYSKPFTSLGLTFTHIIS